MAEISENIEKGIKLVSEKRRRLIQEIVKPEHRSKADAARAAGYTEHQIDHNRHLRDLAKPSSQEMISRNQQRLRVQLRVRGGGLPEIAESLVGSMRADPNGKGASARVKAAEIAGRVWDAIPDPRMKLQVQGKVEHQHVHAVVAASDVGAIRAAILEAEGQIIEGEVVGAKMLEGPQEGEV